MNKKIIGIFGAIIIIGITSLSGCISGGVSAEQIRSFTLSSITNLESYKYTMEMNMAYSMETYGSQDITLNAEGSVDIANSKFYINYATSGIQGIDLNYAMYLIDSTIYMETDLYESEQWIKMDTSEQTISLDSFNQMQSQIELLEVSQVEKLNDESINGVDCYVLKIIPDISKLMELLTTSQGIGSTYIQTGSYYLSNDQDQFVIKLWINKNTNYLMKAYEQINIDTNAGGTSLISNIEITILLTDHNQPVTITLPEEAANAISYTDLFKQLSPTTTPSG